MKEYNIEIGVYSGASAGAIVAAFHTIGYLPEEMFDIVQNINKSDFFKPVFPRTGFLKTQGLRDFLQKHFHNKAIEDLEKPLYVSVTNIKTGKIEYPESGKLVDILMASASVPVLFQPTFINGIPYVDGGVLDNLPVDPIKHYCKNCIAVNVNSIEENDKVNSILNIGERVFHLAISSSMRYKKERANIFIEPPGLMKYGLLDFKKAREIYEAGYLHAIKILEKHRLKGMIS